MKTRNRALSILLCVVMLLALMPSALAAESMPQSGNTENRCFRCGKLLLGFSNRGLKREKQKDPGDFLTKIAGVYLVDLKGFEPSTPTMRMWCAPNCATSPSIELKGHITEPLALASSSHPRDLFIISQIAFL